MILYDPHTGHLQRTDRPLNPRNSITMAGRALSSSSAIRQLIGPTAPISLEVDRHRGFDTALVSLVSTASLNPDTNPIYALQGIGLLPSCPVTGDQYIPEPPQHLQDAWADRSVCVETGRVGHLKNQNTDRFKLMHVNPATGRNTFTTLYRAKIVAAAYFNYHPLTPVMAWYRDDPDTHGYGIENIETPRTAGAYRYSGYAHPPEPHELAHEYQGTPVWKPRYIFTPWTHEDEWPWPTPVIIF